MSVSREDILWDEEMAAEELEGLSEDKLGKLENMARDNEEMEDWEKNEKNALQPLRYLRSVLYCY